MSDQSHVLVADDDDNLRTTLAEQLRMEDYQVTVVSGGEEAIEIIQKEQIDVAVLDIKMPKVDGFQVLQLIRKSFPHIKTIMLTAYADMKNIQKCKELGADDVIQKPYDLGDLFDSIRFVTKK